MLFRDWMISTLLWETVRNTYRFTNYLQGHKSSQPNQTLNLCFLGHSQRVWSCEKLLWRWHIFEPGWICKDSISNWVSSLLEWITSSSPFPIWYNFAVQADPLLPHLPLLLVPWSRIHSKGISWKWSRNYCLENSVRKVLIVSNIQCPSCTCQFSWFDWSSATTTVSKVYVPHYWQILILSSRYQETHPGLRNKPGFVQAPPGRLHKYRRQ